MSTAPVHFSRDLLSSYNSLQSYLVGKETDQRIEKQVTLASQESTNWLGKWNAAPLLAKPFIVIYGLFLKTTGNLLYYSGFTRLGLQLNIKGDLAVYFAGNNWATTFGNDFLANSVNCYSEEAITLYEQPAIHRSDIPDKRIQKIVNSWRFKLKFNESSGFCRGMSYWWLRTFLKLKNHFQDHKQLLQAVGSLFSRGATEEAALVYHLCPDPKFLGLKTDAPQYGSLKKTRPLKSNLSSIAESFKKLPIGAYHVGVPGHSMAYVCLGRNEGVFFDPNNGTAYIHDEPGFSKLAEAVFDYSDIMKEDIFWDLTKLRLA